MYPTLCAAEKTAAVVRIDDTEVIDEFCLENEKVAATDARRQTTE